jgi:ABC-2 type transport system permease protein
MAEQEASQPWVQEEYDRCIEAQKSGDTEQYPADMDCEDVRPQAEWYLDTRTPRFADDAASLAGQAMGLAAVAALILMVSFVSADWSAGTIGTQLVYEPRRRRVLTAKIIVGALAAAVLAIVLLAVVVLTAWIAASAWGSTAVDWGSLGLRFARLVALVVAAGAVGVAITAAIRHSVAVLGIVLGYMLLGEALLRSVWHGAEPWLLTSRVSGWVEKGINLSDWSSCNSAGPMSEPCEATLRHVSFGGSAAYLAILIAALVSFGYVVFQRRDVA